MTSWPLMFCPFQRAKRVLKKDNHMQKTTVFQASRYAVIVLSAWVATEALAQTSIFATPDVNFKGTVTLAQPGPVYPGTEATLAGQGFQAGQRVTLERGSVSLGASPYVVGADGTFRATITIPPDAAVGTQPVVAKVQGPDAAQVVPLKVSPRIPIMGTERFTMQQRDVAQGLYQSAYSARSHALFATSSPGRPPVIAQSAIIKLDPETLATTGTGSAPVANESTRGLFAVYGLAVDDANGLVWTTNTRQSTVAAYRQSDLKLVKQFDAGLVPRAHEVAVDESQHRAYVTQAAERSSESNQNVVSVFDTAKLALSARIAIESTRRGQIFNGVGLALDEVRHRLYVTSLSTGEVAVIDTTTQAVEKVIPLPTPSVMGVAVDGAKGVIFATSPASDSLFIVDAASGRLLHKTLTGAMPLKVVFEPVHGLAYVVNRGSGTITVLDEQGQIVGNLEGGMFPNHASTDGKGNVFAISKTRGGPAGAESTAGDPVIRLSLKR